MRDDACYHIRTSPGQSVCTCLDELMWLRLLVELQARRITQLEEQAQHGVASVLTIERLP